MRFTSKATPFSKAWRKRRLINNEPSSHLRTIRTQGHHRHPFERRRDRDFCGVRSATKRLDHGIGTALDDLATMGVYPSEIGVDLLVLAAHIYAADTRISRDTESQDNWTRELRLVVPVSDHVRWNAVSGILQRMLNFLTGDRWELGFRPRPNGFEHFVAAKPLVGPQPSFDEVSLFSGGLDSLIGAIDALEKNTNPLFVSHAGEGAVSAAQEALFRRLEKQYPNRPFRRLRVWMSFPKELVKDVPPEDSTRGRSFLFFATGVLAQAVSGDRASSRFRERAYRTERSARPASVGIAEHAHDTPLLHRALE